MFNIVGHSNIHFGQADPGKKGWLLSGSELGKPVCNGSD